MFITVAEVRIYTPEKMEKEVAHITTDTGEEYMTHFNIHKVKVGDRVRLAETRNCLGYQTFYAPSK